MASKEQETQDQSHESANAAAASNDVAEDTSNPGDAADPRGSNGNNHRFSDFATASDAEFQRILEERLAENPLSRDYPELFQKAPACFVNWRRRYATSNPSLWRRLFHVDRVLKEFCEAVPVLDAVVRLIETDTRLEQQQQQYTIIDLCSGKGYLGMIFSEMLPPSKVFRIVLMDKAWPMRNSPVKPQHINWEHIYGTYNNNDEKETTRQTTPMCQVIPEETTNTDETATTTPSSRSSYYDTWPIPIDTSKQDLKSSRQLQQIRKHYLSNPSEHPVILLAIHLCGTLSLRAIDLFNTNASIKFLALKPCCLPGMIHAKRHEVFRIGNHCFEASEVCIHGKWKKKKWENGPPRSHLKPKFQKWSQHLYRGIGWGTESTNDDETKNETDELRGSREETQPVRKVHAKIRVQHGGGFQNDFLFAERMPVSSTTVWSRLDQHSSQEDV